MTMGFQRAPAKKVKAIILQNASYDEDLKGFHTPLGILRRVRLIGTVIDKKRFSTNDNPEGEIAGIPPRDRIVFNLDDGTAGIIAQNWDATETTYSDIKVGQDVEVFGVARQYRERVNINIEILRKVEDPNYELLRDLEIFRDLQNPIKSGNTGTIPQGNRFSTPGDSLASKHASNPSIDDLTLQDQVYETILTLDSGNGVAIDDIQDELQVGELTLKQALEALEHKMAISETRPGYYQPL